ncbi:hypothetical protein CsSME_00007826 [Camellia sinensis var. sinensis]
MEVVIVVVLYALISEVHIVYMGERQYEDPASVRKLHHKMLSTLLGSKEAARSSILYSYKHGFSGFAARVPRCCPSVSKSHPKVPYNSKLGFSWTQSLFSKKKFNNREQYGGWNNHWRHRFRNLARV